MQTRGAIQLRPRCTECAGEFSWSTSVAQPVEVFPLVCGDVICRVCLAKRARGAFSSAGLAPVRCCERVVPHDYVQQVLEYAEDVYYSFLVNQTKDGNDKEKTPASHTRTASDPDVVPISSSSGTQNMGDEIETKWPSIFQSRDAGAVASVATGQVGLKTTNSPLLAPKQRSHPRGSNGRFIALVPQIAATPPSQMTCHLCRSVLYIPQLKAPCGHNLCHNCVNIRVLAQLRQDSYSFSVGVPVSCCDKQLPLDVVQRVITGRNLTKYAKMMVKHDIAMKSTTTSNKCNTKRKTLSTATPTSTARKVLKRQISPASFTLRSASKGKGGHQEKECSACFVKVTQPEQWFLGPCGHGYCRSCMTKMANACLEQRDKVPVRCCSTDFPIDYVEQVLSKLKLEKYNRFLREQDPNMSTLQSDHMYAEVVRQHRGKQCPVCGIGVLKIAGCQTMRCALGHVFCWGCGQMRCICGGVCALAAQAS